VQLDSITKPKLLNWEYYYYLINAASKFQTKKTQWEKYLVY